MCVVSDTDNRKDYACAGRVQELYDKPLCSLSIFYCELKTALKNRVFKNIWKDVLIGNELGNSTE